MDQPHAGKAVCGEVGAGKLQGLGPGFHSGHGHWSHHARGQRAKEAEARAQVQHAVAGAQVMQKRVGLLMFVAARGQGLLQPAAQGARGQGQGQAAQGKAGHLGAGSVEGRRRNRYIGPRLGRAGGGVQRRGAVR